MNHTPAHLVQVHAYRAALAAGVPVTAAGSARGQQATDTAPAGPGSEDRLQPPDPPTTGDAAPVDPQAPTCLVFSPHPDDEVVAGALALRLRREHRWRVVNVAVTLGSLERRRAARWEEARRCCEFLGFDLVSPLGTPGRALERITRADARRHPQAWQTAVGSVASLISHHRPTLILAPHALDGHPTHIGTHHLVVEALRSLGPTLRTHLAWSEYWNTQMRPGLMVETTDVDVARLMAALALHEGEVQRHPYHHTLPAWLMDSARRGAERVAGMGAAAHGPVFAALYGWQRWDGRRLRRLEPRIVRADEPVEPLFE
jgi:LmbE family N-acetylglucosaminyl deacetylase